MSAKILELPQFPELVFDDGPHIYRLNGTTIPSVTTIMKPLQAVEYGGIDTSTLNKAADKGTAVHNSIENYIKFGIEDVPSAYEGYFQAYLKFEKDYNPQIIGSESRVYHKLFKYAGTADLSAYIGEQLYLIDFKTTYALIDMLVSVQLEAYAKAFESHGIKYDGKAALQLKKDGSYNFVPFKANDSERWAVFGSLLTYRNYIQKYKK